MSAERKKSRRENPLVSLALNIVIPVIILVRFSGEDELGRLTGFCWRWLSRWVMGCMT